MATDSELKLMAELMKRGNVVFSHQADSGVQSVLWERDGIQCMVKRGEHVMEMDGKFYVLRDPESVGE